MKRAYKEIRCHSCNQDVLETNTYHWKSKKHILNALSFRDSSDRDRFPILYMLKGHMEPRQIGFIDIDKSGKYAFNLWLIEQQQIKKYMNQAFKAYLKFENLASSM